MSSVACHKCLHIAGWSISLRIVNVGSEFSVACSKVVRFPFRFCTVKVGSEIVSFYVKHLLYARSHTLVKVFISFPVRRYFVEIDDQIVTNPTFWVRNHNF